VARARFNLLRPVLMVLGLALLGVAWLYGSRPRPMGDRVEAATGVTGVYTGRSYAWILRTRSGAALIDTGLDPDARALLAELRAQGIQPAQVHSILITHAHPDHWGALKLFPSAQVYAGAEDLPLMRGERPFNSFTARYLRHPGAPPPLEVAVSPLADGQVLSLDGEEVKVIHVPGHTPGSMAFLWKDLLFTGDALIGTADGVTGPRWFLSEDAAGSQRSLEKLRELPFTRIADGHAGVTADARSRLRRLLDD
jgi:glyoxylase-like metal-dependent hydrolase (beta-lactamase superfamily II)